MVKNTTKQNKSERPVDALAVEKGESLTHNLKSRDARASKMTAELVGKSIPQKMHEKYG